MKAMNGTDIDWDALENLLNTWFTSQLSRYSTLNFDSSQCSWDTALRAACLFKRGAPQLRCYQSGEVRKLHADRSHHQAALTSTKTLVHSHFEEFLAEQIFFDSSTTFLCDRNFLKSHPKVEIYLKKSRISHLQIGCSEEKKNLRTVRDIYTSIPKNTDQIVVIGGGICCDIGGLVGGLRGCRIKLVPTTLLAAVDAGLGGKTGVNHPHAGKNQIGLFVELESVHVIGEFLATLDATQVREGISEILKHLFLAGTFERWQSVLTELEIQASASAVNWSDFHGLLKANLEFKKQVINRDRFEKNIRLLLNYGHTTAHLLESLYSFQKEYSEITSISHGCAVAVGQLCFLRLGYSKESPKGYADALSMLLQNEGVVLPLCPLEEVKTSARSLLLQDKKNTSTGDTGVVRCVTPHYGCLQNLPALSTNELFSCIEDNTTTIEVDELLMQLKNAGLFS